MCQKQKNCLNNCFCMLIFLLRLLFCCTYYWFNRSSPKFSSWFSFSFGFFSFFKKRKISQNNYSLLIIVTRGTTRCHSLYPLLSLVVTHCYSLPLVVLLVVTSCHSLSLDASLACLFINDFIGISLVHKIPTFSNLKIMHSRKLKMWFPTIANDV